MPQNALATFKRLARLVDEIWYYAGDVSTDMSWYQKRAVLLGIYASAGTRCSLFPDSISLLHVTEFFYLTDASTNSEETW